MKRIPNALLEILFAYNLPAIIVQARETIITRHFETFVYIETVIASVIIFAVIA